MAGHSGLKLVSFNVGGARGKRRMEEILAGEDGDVIALVDTRWTALAVRRARALWDGTVVVACGEEGRRGVALLFRRGVCESHALVHAGREGRLLVVDAVLGGGLACRLVALYAPNVEHERRDLFGALGGWLTPDCVVMGDFNVALAREDVSAQADWRSDTSRGALLAVVRAGGLVDVWRALHGAASGFSRRQVVLGRLCQSRIDLCLATPGLVERVGGAEHVQSGYSDHDRLCVWLTGSRGGRGRAGPWCFNGALLDDQAYLGLMGRCFADWAEDVEFVEDPWEWWVWVKERVRVLTSRFCRRKRWRGRGEEDALRAALRVELGRLGRGQGGDISACLALRERLLALDRRRCRGAAVRARARFFLQGEGSAAFFLARERAGGGRPGLAHLRDEAGREFPCAADLLDHVAGFYERYFAAEPLGGGAEELLERVPRRVTQADAEDCERGLTRAEVEAALDGLAANKSPGLDGLTAEFYRAFRSAVVPILLRVLRRALEGDGPCVGFNAGLITLLFKSGERGDLANYRPLTMLNVDYKILARVLAGRLRRVMPSVVGHQQTYSVPGRTVADSLLAIRFGFREVAASGGFCLSVDFSKAFDRVDHGFLWAALGRFGFGRRFVGWLARLYEGACSRVRCAEGLTGHIPLRKSIRQGCPLSAFLFAAAVEPLALLVDASPTIRGVPLPSGGELRLVQYADDTTLLVRDRRSLLEALSVIERFCAATGARVNWAKSDLVACGGEDAGGLERRLRIVQGPFKALGVFFGADEAEAERRTWEAAMAGVRRTLDFWRMRALPLQGRAAVLSAWVLSRLGHALAVCAMPGSVLTELHRCVASFVWRGMRVMVAGRTVMGDVSRGGLRIPDMLLRRHALRLRLLARLLGDTSGAPWADFLGAEVRSWDEYGWFNLCRGLRPEQRARLGAFGAEIAEAWAVFRPRASLVVRGRGQLHGMPLFRNPELTVQGRPLEGPAWERVGLRRVWDVLTERGVVDEGLVASRLRRAGGVVRWPRIRAVCGAVRDALAAAAGGGARAAFAGGGPPEFLVRREGGSVGFTALTTRMAYAMLRDRFWRPPAAGVRWRAMFPSVAGVGLWETMTCLFLPPQCRSLDFKIRHRLVYTAQILNRLDRTRSRGCARCSGDVEDLTHLFLDCPAGAPFRDRIRGLLRDRCGLVFGTEQEWRWGFLFGVGRRPGTNPAVCNLILAMARHATWLTRNYWLYEAKRLDTWIYFCHWACIYVSSLLGHAAAPWRRFLGHNTWLTGDGTTLRLACARGELRTIPLPGFGPVDLDGGAGPP